MRLKLHSGGCLEKKKAICWKVYFIFQHKEVTFVLRKKKKKEKKKIIYVF